MKASNRILSLVLTLALLLALSTAAFASGEPSGDSGVVITSVTLREADANYVDSALYSQYETVTFSDGTSRSIDAGTQTFVLVRGGCIVDLADEENWTADAELYVIDKSMYDTVAMSMNTANFSDFWFTAAVDLEDGVYKVGSSVPAAVTGGTVSDTGVSGAEINVDADYVSAIFINDTNASHYDITDVTINSSGLGGNDFGTNGAWGAVVSVGGNADVDITNARIHTSGPLNDGIWAGGSSVVDVYSSVVIATEDAADYDFEAYSYDRFIITDEPLASGEIEAAGISGDYYAEDYSGMFGSGTHYYYFNDNYTSNYSAPMLQCVPLALGLYGSMRATCCYGNGTLSFYDSLVLSDVWAVLSTDSGKGTLNATDTIAAIGVVDEDNADVYIQLGGEEYAVDLYDTTEGCGYVTYCDGFDDNFYGCHFYAPDYLAIITGGTFDFTSSDVQRGYGRSARIGFMSHGSGYTAVLSHSDFEIADTLYSVMSTGAVNITLDDVTVDFTGTNPWSGVLFQFMDTDDTGTDANDMEMDIVDLTYEEYLANKPASSSSSASGEASGSSSSGTTKTLVISNSRLAGDIWNTIGSSNNASTLSTYDGSTNVLSTWSVSTVDITLDNSSLTGIISSGYAQHCDENGDPIVGQFFFNKTGEPMDGTAANTYNYLAARRVINTTAYNGLGRVDVTLTNGAVWTVTGECIINSLTIGEGCVVNGIVTENADGTLTVSPSYAALSVDMVEQDGEFFVAVDNLEDLINM